MNILGRLFGSDEVLKKGVDGVIDGADALVYTQEERAQNFQTLLKLYEPFKIAQRFLALIFSIPYITGWVCVFIMACFGVDTINQEQLLDGKMGVIVSVITGFYFTGGAIEGIVKAATRKV
jgi:hypothetical protein